MGNYMSVICFRARVGVSLLDQIRARRKKDGKVKETRISRGWVGYIGRSGQAGRRLEDDSRGLSFKKHVCA